ncbi:MAG: 2-oxo acid dehydrogenase subunit E2 [Desulfobacterales bacterium]
MATEVLMPKWGLTMKKGKVSKWFKSEGDTISKGEALLEVETDKITNTVESTAAGILFQIVVPAGETVAVQTVLAVVAEPGESPERREAQVREAAAEDKKTAADQPAASGGKKAFVPASPIARRLAKEWDIDLAQVPGTGPGGRVIEADVRQFKEKGPTPPQPPSQTEAKPPVNASPSAVEAAQRAGVDLMLVNGSGPGGKITKVDVLRAINPAFQTSAAAGPLAGTVIPMEGMRKIIADNMLASLRNAAQLTVFVEFDATQMKALRDKIRTKYRDDETVKISFNDIIAYGVCRALQDHPLMNSALADEGIELFEHIHLGIAVALPNGLVVPNVKNAHQKTLLELGAEIRRLAGKARGNGLTMDDIQGGTFTISNVSMLGVDGFTPILNPPEVGILGVGRAVEKPAVVAGEICIRTMMTLSLTFDHRIVDGAPANRFLRTLADYLEDPLLLLA